MQTLIKVTDAAETFIKNKIQESGGIGFRLSIKKTGCSGYAYAPVIVEKEIDADIKIETPQGVKIFVDATWLDKLKGIEIDYQEENQSGLKQKRLVFINPNESSRCGCGESFHTDDAGVK